jgi:hypothetical protein
LKGVGNLGSVPRKVEVPAYALLRHGAATEGVIIEGIVSLIELVA